MSSSRSRIPIVTLGAASAIAQTLVVREALATLGGNEAVIATVFGAWLLLTALGAQAGRLHGVVSHRTIAFGLLAVRGLPAPHPGRRAWRRRARTCRRRPGMVHHRTGVRGHSRSQLLAVRLALRGPHPHAAPGIVAGSWWRSRAGRASLRARYDRIGGRRSRSRAAPSRPHAPLRDHGRRHHSRAGRRDRPARRRTPHPRRMVRRLRSARVEPASPSTSPPCPGRSPANTSLACP
jgi:hypothetical protein